MNSTRQPKPAERMGAAAAVRTVRPSRVRAIQPSAVPAPGRAPAPRVVAQREQLQAMFGQVIGGDAGQVLQCQWTQGVPGPDDFDPDAAVAAADWSNPRYVSVNRGRVQPDDKAWTSYRITAWAPARIGGWEVTVAAHAYFEANPSTGKVRRTPHGHLYVNDWDGWSTEEDGIRAAVYKGVLGQLLGKMDDVVALRRGSVTVAGHYDRESFSPRQIV